MGNGSLQQQVGGITHIARSTNGTCQRVDSLEESVGHFFADGSRTACDIDFPKRMVAVVESLQLADDNVIRVHAALIRHQRQREQGQKLVIDTTVLNGATIIVLILRRHHIFIHHHPLVVFLHIDVTQLAHLAKLVLAPSLLYAQVLVHLRLEHTKLIQLGLRLHAQFTIACGTAHQSCPEVRKLLDDTRIIDDGSPIIACAVEQQSTIVKRLYVVGFIPEHKVEVLDGTVVIA